MLAEGIRVQQTGIMESSPVEEMKPESSSEPLLDGGSDSQIPGTSVTPWLLRRGRQPGVEEPRKPDATKPEEALEAGVQILPEMGAAVAGSRPSEMADRSVFTRMVEHSNSEELRWCLLGAVIFLLAFALLGVVSRSVPVHRLSKVADLHHAVTHGGPVHVASARPPMFDQPDCFSENRQLWEPAKKIWCCREAGIGCSLTSMPFNCHENLANFRLEWSQEKQEWCCAAAQVACG
ncbi:unnamed protein product [Durusdinium trenchii]|uniref:Uncharacterized protein n=1 Tax=Durusdinium trenchii TaxID=1381693 RepID=A0ABP0NFE2_9DINO